MEIISVILDILIPLIITTVFGIMVGKMKNCLETYEKGKSIVAEEAANKAKKEIIDTVIDYASREDQKLQAQINSNNETLNAIKDGMLSVQGRQFKKHCVELLEPGYQITVAEYEEIIKDHDAYNGLGGNHEGDMLFNSVVAKFTSQVAK